MPGKLSSRRAAKGALPSSRKSKLRVTRSPTALSYTSAFRLSEPSISSVGRNRIRVSGGEMLDPITVSSDTAVVVQPPYYVNPLSITGTYLSKLSMLWNKHRCLKLALHYEPIVAATEPGSLGFAYNQDVQDPTPTGDSALRRLMTYAGSSVFPVSRPYTWEVPLQPLTSDLFISETNTGSDYRLVTQGQIYVFTAGGCSAKTYGNVTCSYVWDLEGRQIEEAEAPAASSPGITLVNSGSKDLLSTFAGASQNLDKLIKTIPNVLTSTGEVLHGINSASKTLQMMGKMVASAALASTTAVGYVHFAFVRVLLTTEGAVSQVWAIRPRIALGPAAIPSLTPTTLTINGAPHTVNMYFYSVTLQMGDTPFMYMITDGGDDSNLVYSSSTPAAYTYVGGIFYCSGMTGTAVVPNTGAVCAVVDTIAVPQIAPPAIDAHSQVAEKDLVHVTMPTLTPRR